MRLSGRARVSLVSVCLGAVLLPANGMSGQTIIQHLGAANPVTEGFTLNSTGDVQLGPVFGDLGFDSWMIHSRTHTESATYNYF